MRNAVWLDAVVHVTFAAAGLWGAAGVALVVAVSPTAAMLFNQVPQQLTQVPISTTALRLAVFSTEAVPNAEAIATMVMVTATALVAAASMAMAVNAGRVSHIWGACIMLAETSSANIVLAAVRITCIMLA